MQSAVTMVSHISTAGGPFLVKIAWNMEIWSLLLSFNTFVFAQIFNSVNYRRLDNRLNISEGVFKNMYLIVITLTGKPLPFKF